MKSVVYWDANAFLARINEDMPSDKMAGCYDVWAACEKGLLHIVTSTLTVPEVIYMKGTKKLDPDKRQFINDFFKQEFISLKPLTREIAELARDVVWDCNISHKDAVHVATCGYYKYPYLHSFDKDLVNKGTIEVNGFTIYSIHPQVSPRSQTEMPFEHTEKIPA